MSEGSSEVPPVNTREATMGESQQSDPPQETSEWRRQRHQHHRRENPVRRFLREYPEVFWVAMAALGLFLLVERLNIRKSLVRYARAVPETAVDVVGHLVDSMDRLTLSDLLGFVLLVGASVAIVYRVRWRLMHTTALTTIRCPQCKGEIHRVHRRVMDRVISWVVPVHRYRCSNPACRWAGRRVAIAEGSHRSSRTRP
jgi:hypothetical protein